MQADLVITHIDPLAEINFVDGIEYTISSGNLIKTDTLLSDSPEMLAQKQLNAYNARDIEAFLEPYAEDVKVYEFPNKLTMEGKEAMRKAYSGMFEKVTNLHCELVNRIVQGNTVIDQESVTGFGEDKFEAIAVYKVKDGKIAEVYFLR
ncbi:nuclear transport factor 2 family protein [Fulvivirga sp. 2943]|uniref:Nuclear transport factor 2 family protein n=2 Tax=Fulvivirga sediminis TaxID=2803949 RepID=A0A937F590_9BACT|nr:nuclear transport factor 2 family protein [Fulvivirga sediminis]